MKRNEYEKIVPKYFDIDNYRLTSLNNYRLMNYDRELEKDIIYLIDDELYKDKLKTNGYLTQD